MLAQIEEVKRALSDVRTLASGVLRVGAIHSFVTGLMPQVAGTFVRAHPGIRLQVAELTAADIEAQVAEGALDLGVGFFPPGSDAVLGEHLFDDRLLLASPARHPLARRTSIKFAQLADVPLAMLGRRFATRRLLDSYFQQAGVRPLITVEIASVDALHRIVEHGVASAFLPARTTRPSSRFRLIEVTHPRPVRAGGLIWRRSDYRSAAAQAFVEHLRQTLRDEVKQRSAT